MDRISAALIGGILALLMTSFVIIYETWITGTEPQMEIGTIVMDQDCEDYLAFNNDTSVKNNSARHLWIRAKIIYPELYDQEKYHIVSSSIEQGRWIDESDGWYYYSEPIGLAQTTEPLIDELLYDGRKAEQGGSGRFSLQVEAVYDEWLPDNPDDVEEAFYMMEEIKKASDRRYL